MGGELTDYGIWRSCFLIAISFAVGILAQYIPNKVGHVYGEKRSGRGAGHKGEIPKVKSMGMPLSDSQYDREKCEWIRGRK